MAYLSVIVFPRMLFCLGVRFLGQIPFRKFRLSHPFGYVLPRRIGGAGAMFFVFFLLHSLFSDSVFLQDY